MNATVIIYFLCLVVYNLLKKIYLSCIYRNCIDIENMENNKEEVIVIDDSSNRKDVSYPNVPEINTNNTEFEIQPVKILTRLELENHKQTINAEKNRQKKLKLIEAQRKIMLEEEKRHNKNKQQLISKIAESKLKGKSRIIVPKKVMTRRMKHELRTAYEVEKVKDNSKKSSCASKCLKTSKEIFYYIDFGFDAVGDVLNNITLD